MTDPRPHYPTIGAGVETCASPERRRHVPGGCPAAASVELAFATLTGPAIVGFCDVHALEYAGPAGGRVVGDIAYQP